MKLSYRLFLAIALVLILFGVGNALPADEPPYDLTGTWKLKTEYVDGGFCGRTTSKGKKEGEAIIEQSGTYITVTLIHKNGVYEHSFEGRTSNYFIGAEMDDQRTKALLSAEVLKPDKIIGAFVFFGNGTCPDVGSGAAMFKGVRIAE